MQQKSKFLVQLVVVVALVTVVGWPRFRPLPEMRVWASRGTAPQPDLLARDRRLQDAAEDDQARRRPTDALGRRTQRDTTGAGQGTRTGDTQTRRVNTDDAENLDSLGARLNGIVGRARTLTNIPVPYG